MVESNGYLVNFIHPIFQSNLSFIAEFILIVCVYWNSTSFFRRKWIGFDTNFFEFLPPAILDWADKLVYTVGMVQVSASLPTMIKGLIPPMTGYMSYLLFQREFSIEKIAAILTSLTGIVLGCLV